MTLQLFTDSLAGGRVMELEKVVSMGIGMVRVNVKLLFPHSFGLRALFFRSPHCRLYMASVSFITTSSLKTS